MFINVVTIVTMYHTAKKETEIFQQRNVQCKTYALKLACPENSEQENSERRIRSRKIPSRRMPSGEFGAKKRRSRVRVMTRARVRVRNFPLRIFPLAPNFPLRIAWERKLAMTS